MKSDFIICADARTGSHMLQTALDTHPEINCYGEILNPGSKETLMDRFDHDQAINYVFQNNEKTSGFIIHRHRKDIPPIWESLAANKQLKIIFTTRHDQLRRYGSLKKARLTKKWIEKSKRDLDNQKVKFLDQEFFKEYFYYTERLSKAIQLFLHHPFILVDYEDMINHWEGTLLKVQHFLGVGPQSLSPQTFKQGKTALNEIFENPRDITTNLLKFGK